MADTPLLDDLRKKYEEAKKAFEQGTATAAALKAAEQAFNSALSKAGTALEGKATLKDLIYLSGGAQAVATAFEVLGIKADLLTGNINGVRDSFLKLAGVSKQEEQVVAVITDAFSLKLGPALLKITTLIDGAALKAQKFQVELTKFGQDQTFQKSIAEQAQQLAFLGISYDNLKEANTALLTNYNASIAITDKSTKAFEENRKGLAQLSVFNKKFGIEYAETAKVMNFANDTMNIGAEGATKLSDTLLKFADETGQNANAVFTAFNTQLDRFAVLSSDKAVQAFERIQMTAKRTGQSVETVFNAIAKFDEIDEGFKTGGQLNRVLSFMGGSFDTFKAIQASDEERAQMLYESIAGVADKYSQLTTDQAKRSMARQIAESSGVDLKTVVGLLNKSTDLSRDIMDISKRPLVTEGFTEKERADKMVALSTREDFQNARDQLLEVTNAAQKLAISYREADKRLNMSAVQVYKKLDDVVLTPIFTKHETNIKEMFKKLKAEWPQDIKDAAKKMSEVPDKIKKAVDKFDVAVDKIPQGLGTGYPSKKGKPAANPGG